MKFYNCKGNRIRASDNSLVFCFYGSALLSVFTVVLLLLNSRQLMRIDWKAISLRNGMTFTPTPYHAFTVCVGTGKTFAAACIANVLTEQGIPVLMTNFSKILNSLSGMFSEDRNKYLASFGEFELLIIDDLGIERNSEYAQEQVYNVVASRYLSRLPFIITTNLTLAEHKERYQRDFHTGGQLMSTEKTTVSTNSATATQENDCPALVKKIGKTTYRVHIHFSTTSIETMSDKIKRMLKNEIKGLSE